MTLKVGRQTGLAGQHRTCGALGIGGVGFSLGPARGPMWVSRFSDFAGSITGPLLTYEVLTAFFLEAGFLGVMLFGLNRVGRGLHLVKTEGMLESRMRHYTRPLAFLLTAVVAML